MYLKFTDLDGSSREVLLTGRPSITFGRSPEADISIPDTRISRIHAEIRTWDRDLVIKDMGSRNGILINGIKTEVAILHAGDTFRIGSHEFSVEQESKKGTTTIVREVTQEIADSKKGYRTILREIVKDTDNTKRKPGITRPTP